jgi:carbon-monoxide dehydrogenase large subunit
MSVGDAPPLRYTGMRIKRLEDPRLLTGRGRYLDDLGLPRMLFASFVRSPHAHARIIRIDGAAARAVPGVVAVITAEDLRPVTRPLSPRLDGAGFVPTAWPALADGVARFCGEAVAAVVAANPYVAADARELVGVEWEARPAVATIDQALASAVTGTATSMAPSRAPRSSCARRSSTAAARPRRSSLAAFSPTGTARR